MEKWRQDLENLLYSNRFGIYTHCKVDQIVLLDKTEYKAWNYFTHIHFSKKYTEESESKLLGKVVTIGKNLSLIISTYTMTKERFLKCVEDALSKGIWSYTDSKIDGGDFLDEPFETPIKYVAENDPTGSLYNKVIPLEQSLYGTNFNGNYYLFEIYAKAKQIGALLCQKDKERIQDEIKKRQLNYQLTSLNDRIGNIVCKFENEILLIEPVSCTNGMSHQLSLVENTIPKIKLHIHIEQEHDGLLYECRDENLTLRKGETFIPIQEYPSQCKTTVTATDKKTGLVVYRYTSDQSVYTGYRGQISPRKWVSIVSSNCRKIRHHGKDISIALNSVHPFGNIDAFTEMLEAGKRQQQWEDTFFQQQKYLNVYYGNEHEKALCDLRKIINHSVLLWDLQEICLIDPYLSADDILDTVVYCKQPNIRIRCVTSIGTIAKNKDAKNEILTDNSSGNNAFESAKAEFKKLLQESIPSNCDLKLSFKTTYGNYGCKFHDRYLILRYRINRTRVWSLGASVNSIGKSHHIIQIVESPTLIEEFFNKVWSETNVEECKIYETNNYKQANS